MALSNQKIIQNYLQKHEVSQLFENMMAKVIKDMPNDPVIYLTRLLHKLHQRKNDIKLNSVSLSKSEMGLVGSSVPKKLSKDPQVILPGSKPVISAWSSGKESHNNNLSQSVDILKSKKNREYEKPWLLGAKHKKGSAAIDAHTSWSGDVYSKTLDEGEMSYFKEQKMHNKQYSSSLTDASSPSKKKENSWNSSKENKENTTKTPRLQQQMHSDDELNVDSLTKEKLTSKVTFSPSTYAKFKKHSSKKKSLEQKTKLQALLSSDNQKNRHSILLEDDSSNDEGIEVIENTSDLAEEGARNKRSCGQIKQQTTKISSSSTGVNISMCCQCARVMSSHRLTQSSVEDKYEVSDTEALFKPTQGRAHPFSFSQTDDDDFESVSQINVNRPYKATWPSIDQSEDETEEVTTTRRRNIKVENEEKKSKKKVSMNDDIETDKSDFFTTNSPLRKKTRPFNLNPESGNESVTDIPLRSSLNKSYSKKQAWNHHQTVIDTESDRENVLDLKASARRARGGWNQKIYAGDESSD